MGRWPPLYFKRRGGAGGRSEATHPGTSRCGSLLLLSLSADVRSADDVIGFKGTVAANSEGVVGISPGLRTTTLHVIEGDVVATSTFGNATAAGLPATFLGISLAGTGSSGNNPANSSSSTAKVIAGKSYKSIVISTNKRAIASEVLSKTGAYRAREAGTLQMYV